MDCIETDCSTHVNSIRNILSLEHRNRVLLNGGMINRIRELRNGRGWSQQKLGDKIGASGQHVGLLEKDERGLNLDWLRKISSAFELPVSSIIGENAPEQAATRCAMAVMDITISRKNARLTSDLRAALFLKLYELAAREQELSGTPSISALAAEDALKSLHN